MSGPKPPPSPLPRPPLPAQSPPVVPPSVVPPAAVPPAAERPLGAGPFMAVWIPSLVTVISTGLCIFGLGWWISRAPGGGAHLGTTVALSSALSLIVTTVLAGTLDRADRRRGLVVLLTALLLPLAVLTVVFGRRPDVGTLVVGTLCYVVVFTLQTLYMAAMENLGADLAPGSWPPVRTALLTQIHTQVARAAAPIVGGGLLAAGSLRGLAVIALGGVLVVLVAVRAARRHIDLAPVARTGPPGRSAGGAGALRRTLREAADSTRLIRSRPELVFLVLFGALANLVVFPFYAVLPAFIDEYRMPAAAQAGLYSWASSAYGVGMLAGTVLLIRVRGRSGTVAGLRTAASAFAAICLVLLLVTVVPWPPALVVAMALAGALFAVLVAVGGAVWLDRTPAAIRVRVFSLRRLSVFSSIPLGSMLMGIGGSQFGYRVFVRVLLVLVLAVLAWLWAGFLRGRPDGPAVSGPPGAPA
ncbi:hypothetical protein ACFXKJ_07025 [Kitasatospora indigofera]|uniref:hypothetical protein n=1 Tax=Kitasatospora indigofera TaxID=67307 RepID=UPI00368AFA95